MTPNRHQIPEKTLLALAMGGGGTEAIDILRRVQHSKRRLLLRAIPPLAANVGHPWAAMAKRGYDALAEVETHAPDAVAAVLRHPAVASWAQHTVIALNRGAEPDPGGLAARGAEADPGGLAAVAAAAAVRAGLEVRLEVPLRAGGVVLPSLGRAVLPGIGGRSTAVVRSRPGRVEVSAGDDRVRLPLDPHQDRPGWQALRIIRLASPGLDVEFLFDDVDPYRLPGAETADRPSAQELDGWRALLRPAWELLAHLHRAAAEETAGLITTLVPMATTQDTQVSTTSLQAVGGLGLSRPHDTRFLAMTFVHETQHAKLYALMDAVRLTGPDTGRRFYAPWREDPRPIAGLLHGAYAFLGVAGFWRLQREHEHGPLAMHAHSEFARWRDGAILVARTLGSVEGLTAEGRRFVAGMARTLESWRGDAVPAEAAARAREEAEQHLARWRLRNGEPPAEQPVL